MLNASKLIKHSLQTAVLASLLLSTATPVLAQSGPSAEQIIRNVLNRSESVGFTGTRQLKVFRQNTKAIMARAKIEYKNKDNYRLRIIEPLNTIKGIEFNMEKGINSAYFPDEKLYLYNGSQSTSYMPERIILSRFGDRLDLMKQNYEIKRKPDDFVASTATYVVEFIPKHTFKSESDNNTYWVTPRRMYWIDKETGYILREDRFWDLSGNAYSTSQFEIFQKKANLTPSPINDPQGARKVDLSGKQNNSFLSYSSVAEAERKEGIKMSPPNYKPQGFELKEIQVFTLFGARIQVFNYTDGLNDLMITIRPQQNAFVTLLAGAASLNLIKKISDLSSQAPNNYYSQNLEKLIAVAFGDVAPEELAKVAKSIQG